MKKIISMVMSVLLLCVCVLSGCNSGGGKHTFVKLTLDEGEIIIETYPEIAPESVKLFLDCVKSGYYDGKVFHRSIPGLVQGGSADGFGVGGSGKSIKGEFTENGFENNLKHERGVLSMARADNHNSASGQFFIMVDAAPYLDGKYATFAKVVEGIEIADKMAALPTRGLNHDEIIKKPVIKKAEILKDYTLTKEAE
ncbi:MAG: peptidylprolyl isomerase [Ruminococcaceae bacterium]|nr:peptidylprolyl isomerase [Oscillospiraceae bacterium]